jgi:hypothetical protein
VQKNLRYSEWDWVELTEDEKIDALGYRRMLKGTDLKKRQKEEYNRLKIAKLQSQWTYDELRAEILSRALSEPFEFVIDEHNERIIHLLCLYFSGDERFNSEKITYHNGEERSLNLSKGIGLISSKKGTGKSILMKLFQQNKRSPYLKIDTKDIASEYKKKGDACIETYSNLLYIPPNPTFFCFQKIGICFDELGYELPKNNWGDKSDVMADVLFNVYKQNQYSGDYSNFHFTSNLSGQDFEGRYGDRIKDRMREMFNVIIVSGDSRRK